MRLEAGKGGRPLLLVHGFGGAKEDFADWMDTFAEHGWHAVSPDLRGHGEGHKPDGEEHYGFDFFVEDLIAIADEYGWGRFVLVGHSMGGMVAQMLALKHPDRLDGLILMDTSHGPVPHVDPELRELGKQVAREQGLAVVQELTKTMEGADPLGNPAHERMLRERAGYREFCDNKFLSLSVPMWVTILDALFVQEDRLDGLRELDVPTLVMVGELDTEFRATSAEIAEAMPNATLAVIPDAGHAPQFENPEAWWKAMAGFLQQLREPAQP
jgi:pimeloyl-ACP methyl ester carboxylesterase